MLLRYAFLAAAALSVAGIAEAQAQSPFPPAGQEQASPFPPVGGQQASPFPPAGQQASPFPPVGQQSSPFPTVGQPQQQQQQKPLCYDQFMPLRQEVDKRFATAKKALDRRGGAAELCNLLTKFSDAELTMMKYVEQNSQRCNFPPTMLENIKASNAKSQDYKKQACTAAAGPARAPRPVEPTLSDAFGAPALNKDTTRTGRGTLDSLSGNPLAR